MTSRIGTKGQVVIPKAIRDELHIGPGDEVRFELDEDGVRVRPVRGRHAFRGAFRGISLTDDLLAERRLDREREDRAAPPRPR